MAPSLEEDALEAANSTAYSTVDALRQPGVGKLVLADCALNAVPAGLHRLTLLRELDLQGNDLLDIADGALPPNLRSLTLTNNQLSSLPTELPALPALQRLFAGGNFLRYPAFLQALRCKSLVHAGLAYNRIGSVNMTGVPTRQSSPEHSEMGSPAKQQYDWALAGLLSSPSPGGPRTSGRPSAQVPAGPPRSVPDFSQSLLLSLDISHNDLVSLDHTLTSIVSLPRLQVLSLEGNPLALRQNYRQRIIDSVQPIKMLDGRAVHRPFTNAPSKEPSASHSVGSSRSATTAPPAAKPPLPAAVETGPEEEALSLTIEVGPLTVAPDPALAAALAEAAAAHAAAEAAALAARAPVPAAGKKGGVPAKPAADEVVEPLGPPLAPHPTYRVEYHLLEADPIVSPSMRPDWLAPPPAEDAAAAPGGKGAPPAPAAPSPPPPAAKGGKGAAAPVVEASMMELHTAPEWPCIHAVTYSVDVAVRNLLRNGLCFRLIMTETSVVQDPTPEPPEPEPLPEGAEPPRPSTPPPAAEQAAGGEPPQSPTPPPPPPPTWSLVPSDTVVGEARVEFGAFLDGETLTRSAELSFIPTPRILDEAGRFPTLAAERARPPVGSFRVTATRGFVALGGFPAPPLGEMSTGMDHSAHAL